MTGKQHNINQPIRESVFIIYVYIVWRAKAIYVLINVYKQNLTDIIFQALLRSSIVETVNIPYLMVLALRMESKRNFRLKHINVIFRF